MKKVTFLFKNSGFYHCKSTQENTENENSWRFFGLKSLQKKREKNGKSLIFQKSLTSLKRVQIAFWIVEKIAEECFNPNPKDEKNS